MCMFEGADCEIGFHKATMRTARKQHVCQECGRMIEPGESYEFVAAKYDGDLWTGKTCAHCVAVRKWLIEVCGGYIYGGVRDDLSEHKHEGYNPRWLAAAVGCMGRKWRNSKGNLFRPMKLPKNLSPLPSHAP